MHLVVSMRCARQQQQLDHQASSSLFLCVFQLTKDDHVVIKKVRHEYGLKCRDARNTNLSSCPHGGI